MGMGSPAPKIGSAPGTRTGMLRLVYAISGPSLLLGHTRVEGVGDIDVGALQSTRQCPNPRLRTNGRSQSLKLFQSWQLSQSIRGNRTLTPSSAPQSSRSPRTVMVGKPRHELLLILDITARLHLGFCIILSRRTKERAGMEAQVRPYC